MLVTSTECVLKAHLQVGEGGAGAAGALLQWKYRRPGVQGFCQLHRVSRFLMKAFATHALARRTGLFLNISRNTI